MSTLRTLALTAMLALTLSACAHYRPGPGGAGHSAHHPPGAAAAAATPAERMAQMDAHMNAMRDMHEKMVRASSPQERQALMGEHQKLMQEGMALMGGMGHGPRAGMPGMGGMQGMGQMGAPGMPMDPATRQQMMEMRMEMMQSMMQMMMDRTSPAPGKP
jgi:hypothetical protein